MTEKKFEEFRFGDTREITNWRPNEEDLPVGWKPVASTLFEKEKVAAGGEPQADNGPVDDDHVNDDPTNDAMQDTDLSPVVEVKKGLYEVQNFDARKLGYFESYTAPKKTNPLWSEEQLRQFGLEDTAKGVYETFLEQVADRLQDLRKAQELLSMARSFEVTPDGAWPRITVEARGTQKEPAWAICDGGHNLNKNGNWEYERLSSNRTEDFLERCRWSSLEEAIEIAKQQAAKEAAQLSASRPNNKG